MKEENEKLKDRLRTVESKVGILRSSCILGQMSKLYFDGFFRYKSSPQLIYSTWVTLVNTFPNPNIRMSGAVHRYPVPAPYRIPLRKIPVNTRFRFKRYAYRYFVKQALSLVLDIDR